MLLLLTSYFSRLTWSIQPVVCLIRSIYYMYLKSISVKGFKSFAKKTELEFEPGITMIVGPNGSGKSNVTDAIQWVLGEQSPSALRGSAMQDVIFAGSLNHKALGLAEVTLALDNSNRTLDLDFSEVTITRRVLRSGENHYYINSSPCRLLDIYELLSDSGLGRQTHSIIGQGKLDEIVNSKPEDKRVLLEEAAGVLKHKKRKERALRKLISTEENINRAKDILREVNQQIKPLEIQVSKAHTFNELSTELKKLEIAYLVSKISGVKNRWEKISDQEKEVKEKTRPLQDKISEINKQINIQEERYQSQAALAAEQQKLKEQLNHRVNALEKLITVQNHRQENIENNNGQLKEQFDSLESALTFKQAQAEAIENQISTLAKEINANLKAIAVKRKQSEEFTPSYLELTKDIAEVESKLNELAEKIKQKENQSLTKLNDVTYLEKESQNQSRRIIAFKEEVKEKTQKLEALKSQLNKNNEAQSAKQQELDVVLGQKNEVEQKLKENEALIMTKNEQQSQISGKLSFLQNLYTDLDPKEIVKLADSRAINAKSLAKMLKIKKKHIKAIESYLGNVVQGLVVESFDEAKQLLSLARQEQRQISLIISNQQSGDDLAEALLKDIKIVNSIDEIDTKSNDIFVTLDGEIYSGQTFKADYRNSKKGLLSLRADIEDNQSQLETLSVEIKNLNEQKSEFESGIQSTNQQITQLQTQIHDYKEQAAKISGEVQFSNQTLEQQERTLEDLIKSVAAAAIGIEKNKQEKVLLNSELDALVKEKIALEKNIASLKDLEGKAGKDKQANQLVLTELNLQNNSLSQQQISLQKQLQTIVTEKEETAKQQQRYLSRFSANEKGLMLLKRFLPVGQKLSEVAALIIERIKDAEISTDSLAGLKTLRQNEKDLNQTLREYEQQIQQFDITRSSLKSSLDSLADRIVQEHGIAIETAIKEYAQIEVDQARINQIKSELSTIGPVNAIAESQFKELGERKEFLEKQISDLLNGKSSIGKIIRAIDKKIKDKLLNAFDEISVSFKDMFAKLFPGGQAELVLTGEDISDSGLEIKAQPYGKSPKKLSLLSGGETALTALALLFAVYHTKPSPFYVLDEVEAALDDINLQRFIRLLKDMKTKTQFLVVTHQRRTMEVADALYGVTMQADGVSKVVSQKINEREQELNGGLKTSATLM